MLHVLSSLSNKNHTNPLSLTSLSQLNLLAMGLRPLSNRDTIQLWMGHWPSSTPTLESERHSRVEGRGIDPESCDYAPDYVWACSEASLQRLAVDYIDLYYQRRIDQSVPIEETVCICWLWTMFCSLPVCLSSVLPDIINGCRWGNSKSWSKKGKWNMLGCQRLVLIPFVAHMRFIQLVQCSWSGRYGPEI